MRARYTRHTIAQRAALRIPRATPPICAQSHAQPHTTHDNRIPQRNAQHGDIPAMSVRAQFRNAEQQHAARQSTQHVHAQQQRRQHNAHNTDRRNDYRGINPKSRAPPHTATPQPRRNARSLQSYPAVNPAIATTASTIAASTTATPARSLSCAYRAVIRNDTAAIVWWCDRRRFAAPTRTASPPIAAARSIPALCATAISIRCAAQHRYATIPPMRSYCAHALLSPPPAIATPPPLRRSAAFAAAALRRRTTVCRTIRRNVAALLFAPADASTSLFALHRRCNADTQPTLSQRRRIVYARHARQSRYALNAAAALSMRAPPPLHA